jgi:hypothetical protein
MEIQFVKEALTTPVAPRAFRTLLCHEVLEDESELLQFDLSDELNGEEGEEAQPREEVAQRFHLTQEEWRRVRNAPLVSFLAVASADGVVQPRERLALVRALEDGLRSTCELFRESCRELLRERDTLLGTAVCEALAMERVFEVYQLVADKVSREDAERLKWCLLEVGRRVAEAAGGLFASWGWLRRPERQALAALAVELSSARDAILQRSLAEQREREQAYASLGYPAVGLA